MVVVVIMLMIDEDDQSNIINTSFISSEATATWNVSKHLQSQTYMFSTSWHGHPSEDDGNHGDFTPAQPNTTSSFAVPAASLPASALLAGRMRLHPLGASGGHMPGGVPHEEAVRPLHHHPGLRLVRAGPDERPGAVHAGRACGAHGGQLPGGQHPQRHRPPARPVW